MEPIKTLGFFHYVKLTFLTLFIIIILLDVIYNVYTQRSVLPVVKGLGSTFFLITQNLHNTTLQLINQGALYVPTPDFWTGIWNLTKTLSKFFAFFYIIYLWIKILTTLFAFLFFGGNKNFAGFILALVLFIGLQSFFIITIQGINKSIDCFSGCEKSITTYISIPVVCVYDLIRVFPVLVTPAHQIYEGYEGNFTPSNITFWLLGISEKEFEIVKE